MSAHDPLPSKEYLGDGPMLDLAKRLIEHVLKNTAICDCRCAHCSGFKEEAPQWLEALANRIGAGIPPDGAPSMPTGLAALIRQRYTRDNWSGLTYDEAMAVAAALEAHGNETPAAQAPIAHLHIFSGRIAGGYLYAPSLPDGEHDLYCEPMSVAPALKALEQPKVAYNSNGDAYLVEKTSEQSFAGVGPDDAEFGSAEWRRDNPENGNASQESGAPRGEAGDRAGPLVSPLGEEV